jgi:CRP/FNR family transcriptional regulator, cyclic AMP receptor protein
MAEYLDQLAKVPLFAGLSRGDLEKVARAANEITVEPGRALVTEGETGHEAFIVVDGTAAVTSGGTEVATVGPGAVFGEMALIDRAPRNATVTATTPMKVLVLGQREFTGLLDESPGFTRSIMAALAYRVREKDSEHWG